MCQAGKNVGVQCYVLMIVTISLNLSNSLLYLQLLIEAGCEDVFSDVLDFVQGQGRKISQGNDNKVAPSNEDEAMEVIIQTVEDIVSSASDQPLPKVSHSYVLPSIRIVSSCDMSQLVKKVQPLVILELYLFPHERLMPHTCPYGHMSGYL